MNEDIVERCRDLADASWQGRRGRVEKALHDAAAEIERLRAALDEITHYWSGGPIDPGWKEIARRALKETS